MFQFINNVRAFIDRGKRGWANTDVWDGDTYLGKVISGMVRELAKYNSGCPEELYDKTCKNDECHKWKEILEEIAQGFEAADQMKRMSFSHMWEKKEDIYDSMYKKIKQKQLAKKYDRGMELFSKYFLNLWD